MYIIDTGETEYCEVTATFVRESDHINYLTIVDEHGHEQVIETTDGHPFWVVTDEPDLERAARSVIDENGILLYHENLEPGLNGFWVEAKDLRVGDMFLGANGELSTLINIVRVEQEGGIAVFNFEVEGNHNYFILAKEYELGQTCVLVHNADGGAYVLVKDGKVRRTGRTKNLRDRELAHRREFPDHEFEPRYPPTDDPNVLRGLEDKLYNEHIDTALYDKDANPLGLNRIRAISETNPNKPTYIKAADDFLKPKQ